MNALLKANKKKIQINPFCLSGVLYPLVDNDHDSYIENKTAIPAQISYLNPVRISTKKKPIKNTRDESTPYTYEEVFFMFSDVNTIVDERLEFNYKNCVFKVMKRIQQRKYEQVTGYEYELKDITQDILYS